MRRELADYDRAIVEQMVKHVDGMPLAMKLALAGLRVLSPSEILASASRRFELLNGGEGACSGGARLFLGPARCRRAARR
ncbi:hypothetical protein WMF45_05655 [Sorangium sp. So ce448]|uniref:hypothetical protein n=1 Tax=Sorangium sp. So ce448 TaxID=3133314 RepID=UPI003F643DE4